MLRKVANYSTQDWERQYEALRKDIDKFRYEIQAIEKREDAILEIARLDGFISLFMIIKIFEEMQIGNEKALEACFQENTGKELKRAVSKYGVREIIKKALGKDVRAFFEEVSDKTRMADLTAELVSSIVTPVVQSVYDKTFKKHITRNADVVEQRFKSLLCNAIFLICATELYKEADLRQTAGSIRIKLLMGPYLLRTYKEEALQNPFIAVRESAKLVQIDPPLSSLWQEAALWLQGLYTRSYLQIPEEHRKDGEVKRKDNGKMPTVNEKDVSFQDNFNLTLYEMALFHKQTSEVIQAKLAPPVVHADVVPVSSHDPVMPSPVSEMQPASSSNPQHAQVEPREVIPALQSGIAMPSVVSDPIPLSKLPGGDKEKPLLPFLCLDDIRNENEDVQFPMLIYYLDRYRLNEAQNSILLEFSGVITSKLKGYTTSILTTHYIPTMLWSRPHTQSVNETLESLDSAAEADESIKLLFSLWKEIGEKGSKDLKKIVADLIKSAFTILLKASMPAERMEVKSTIPL
ncbi:hypothetical protein AQUSIP_17770 [Aquicella siphonis]|uniref:Uncharacterized protein n=1 Tax=Aquicella siphonis TaxID=254247 RepID=A0A5E4PHS2_9COXI|nr:hypothetical protein [Aquicella siphonis]VVC76464.1 hypothetical protein AQUSIP_17770 [Aquicella siphonis]